MPDITRFITARLLWIPLLVATSAAPALAQTPTPTPTPNGPRITFMQPVFGDGCPFCCSFSCQLTPTPTPMFDAQGRQIFVRNDAGFIIVVEGTGTSEEGSVRVSSSTGSRSLVPITHSSGRPALQVLITKIFGNGSTARCDIVPPNAGGVPAIVPPDFREGTDVTNALVDMACRFDVLTSQIPCTKTRFGEFAFLGTGTQRQFCYLVPRTAHLSAGDTVVAAQIRNASGVFGSRREIVIRVGSPPPSSPSPTPTRTPTRTATPSVHRIAGRIRYYSADRPVAAAAVRLTGPAQNNTTTTGTGTYSFPSLTQGNWTVRPSKTGDFGSGISSLDAANTLKVAVRDGTFTDLQKLACDVTGNGSISSLDAARILQWRVRIITRFPVAETCTSDWAFVPMPAAASNQQVTQPVMTSGTCTAGSISYSPLVGAAVDQNFHAVLFGDCTGNWQPTAPALSVAPAERAGVRLGRPRLRGRRWVRVPVFVEGTFSALELAIEHDSSLRKPRVRRARGARHALLAAGSPARGRLLVALASAKPVGGGAALYVDFELARGRASQSWVELIEATVDDLPAAAPEQFGP